MRTLADSAECSPENVRFHTHSPLLARAAACTPNYNPYFCAQGHAAPNAPSFAQNGALADELLSEKRSDAA